MSYGGFAYGAGAYGEGQGTTTAGAPGHGYISDFDPFGTGGVIEDHPTGDSGIVTDSPPTGGHVQDRSGG